MKTLKRILPLILAVFITCFACQNEDEIPSNLPGSVQFSLGELNSGSRGSAAQESELANARALVVTIKDNEGNLVYEQEQIEVFNFSGTMVGSPISLNPGSYRLTEFLVLDDQGAVIFATPMEGSEYAHLVSDPLPINFIVTADETTTVVPEVISTEEFTPEDFGYVSFRFSLVEYFNFLIAVHVFDEGNQSFELTSAQLTVTDQLTGDVLYTIDLEDKTNTITIRDGYDYRLSIKKAGYLSQELDVTNQGLKSHATNPIVITLQINQALPSDVFVNSGQMFNSSGTDVASGDLDNDGDLDLFMTRSNELASEVWLNDGAGNFSNSGQLIGSSNASYVVLGDLDGDGDLDAFITNEGNQPNTVWWNDGAANFTNSGQALGNESSYFADLGDLDGDGDLDVVVGNAASQPNNIWFNDGTGNFSLNQNLGTTEAHGLDLGDVDGDGDLDIFVASLDQSDQLWFNDGNGSFTMSGQSLGNGRSVRIALVDLDGDEDLDAFVAYHRFNSAYQQSKVLLNDGTGNFSDTGQELGNHNVNGLAMVDFDLDGDLDALTVSYYSEPYKLWINDGNGVFTDSGLSLGNYYATGLTVGDFDGDGDQDFFVMHVGSAHILWLGEQN